MSRKGENRPSYPIQNRTSCHTLPEDWRGSSSEPLKRCTKCGQHKPPSEFYANAAGRDGLRSDCKTCVAARRKKWYAENREREIERVTGWQRANKDRYNAKQRRYRAANKERIRDQYVRRTFGITLADYERMLDEQDGGCAICGAPEPEGSSLHVDHDHDTGEVRALLCFPCNNALGLLGDDPERVATLLEYLEEPGGARTRIDEQVAAIKERAASLTREASV